LFNGNIDIDGDGNNDLTSNGNSDSYVFKFSEATNAAPRDLNLDNSINENISCPHFLDHRPRYRGYLYPKGSGYTNKARLRGLD